MFGRRLLFCVIVTVGTNAAARAQSCDLTEAPLVDSVCRVELKMIFDGEIKVRQDAKDLVLKQSAEATHEFIERGLDIIDPASAGRRRYRFIGQETDKPHALTVMHMNEYWMTMGRKKVEAGIALWRPAVEHNYWRGYGTKAVIPEYPGFKEKQWLEREMSGEFEQDTSLIMAG